MSDASLPSTPDGLTLMQIMERFQTVDAARAYLEAIRWPNGPVCPHCGNADAARIYAIEANAAAKVRAGLRECAECKRQFTVTVGTIFEDSKVPLNKWLIAWYLLCSSKKGFSAAQLQRTLGLGSYRTAWFMLHRIRFAMKDPCFAGALKGTVECDETWIGGKVRGMGRGYRDNKVPVVTLVERSGRVRSRSVDRVTGENLGAVLAANVDPKATLMTDDYGGYKKPGKMFSKHKVVRHKAGEYVRGTAHTNTVEGFFGNMKRGINGIYHHVGRQYIDQYLGEFDFRYNMRKTTDGARTVAGIRKAEGKRLMLKRGSSKKESS